MYSGRLSPTFNYEKKDDPARMSFNISISYLLPIDYEILPVLQPESTINSTFSDLSSRISPKMLRQ